MHKLKYIDVEYMSTFYNLYYRLMTKKLIMLEYGYQNINKYVMW